MNELARRSPVVLDMSIGKVICPLSIAAEALHMSDSWDVAELCNSNPPQLQCLPGYNTEDDVFYITQHGIKVIEEG